MTSRSINHTAIIAKPNRKPIKYRKQWQSMLLSFPALLLYTLVFIYPMITVFRLSFFSWNGIPSSAMEFVGFKNFVSLFHDSKFMIAFKNVMIMMLSGFVLIMPISFFLATVVQSKMKGSHLLRTAYFIPQIICRTAIALMWYFILYPEGGPLSTLCNALGIYGIDTNFLGSMKYAFYAIVVINAWTYAGYNMLIFSAGLTSIPSVFYEAASIDGATNIQKLWYITLPQMKGSFQIFALNCIIGSITTFEMIFATTGGGPGNATEVFGTLLYKNAFTYNRYGYANAVGTLLIVTCLVVSLLLTKLFDRSKEE
ncbi:MAG: sugar ABC transporter permease [Clostridia bacterium]